MKVKCENADKCPVDCEHKQEHGPTRCTWDGCDHSKGIHGAICVPVEKLKGKNKS
jgi:hypothetical protein